MQVKDVPESAPMQLQPVLVFVCASLHHIRNQSYRSLGTEPALDASGADRFAELCRQRTVHTCQDCVDMGPKLDVL